MRVSDGGAFLPAILLGVGLAVGPFLAATIYLARFRGALWKAFVFGWAGWLLALVIRLVPVQVPQVLLLDRLQSDLTLALLLIVYASAMAGLFEEGVRYWFLRRWEGLRASRHALLAFALGWGVGEALVLYVPAVATLPLVQATPPALLDVLPGALERNLAILAHLSFTFVVLAALGRGKGLLALAMALHFALDFVIVAAFQLTGDIWLAEGLGVVLVAGLLSVAYGLRPSRWGEAHGAPTNVGEAQPRERHEGGG